MPSGGALRRAGAATRDSTACARALRFDDPSYITIKRILNQGLDAETVPDSVTPPPARKFVRSAVELVGHLVGGVRWN